MDNISLRDYLAGQALIGYMYTCNEAYPKNEALAEWSYQLADAMLAERERHD